MFAINNGLRDGINNISDLGYDVDEDILQAFEEFDPITGNPKELVEDLTDAVDGLDAKQLMPLLNFMKQGGVDNPETAAALLTNALTLADSNNDLSDGFDFDIENLTDLFAENNVNLPMPNGMRPPLGTAPTDGFMPDIDNIEQLLLSGNIPPFLEELGLDLSSIQELPIPRDFQSQLRTNALPQLNLNDVFANTN